MMADDILKTTMTDKLPTDLEGMEASMERLLSLIDDVYKYVDNVDVRIRTFFNQCYLVFLKCNNGSCFQEGRVAPDNSVGRFLWDAVESLPKLPPAAFDKLVNDSLQVL